jgi:subtilisin family serine protease
MLMYWLLSAAMAQSSLQTLDAAPGEYLVKLKGGRSAQTLHTKVAGKLTFKGQIARAGVFHLKLENSQDFQTLSHDPDVEYIEPNYILAKVPTVPMVDAQGNSVPEQIFSEGEIQALTSTTYSQNYAPVQILQSWSIESAYNANNRPIVAIVDTGIDLTHSVFTQTHAIWTNTGEIAANGIDDDFNGYVDDVNGWNFNAGTNSPQDDEGHGSHVGGIVVGTGLDIFSSSRDLSKIQIMPLKFLDSTGSGRTSDAISAIYYAVDNGAKVINCSWGGGSFSRSLLDALTYAYNNQVLVVTAAGNNATNNDSSPMYPASYNFPSNIAVAASMDNDQLASFSNYGASTVPVAAPGYYIYSAYKNGGYTLMSGTSMAAPFVAGIAAQAWREAPQLTGYQVKQLVLSTVNTVGTLTGKVSTGGRVNSYNLISQSQGSVSTLAAQPSYTPDYSAAGASDSAAKSVGGCGLVKAISSDDFMGGNGFAIGLTLFACLLPFGMWITFYRMNPQQRRKYERFSVKSGIKVQLGDREIVGQMNTISQGGLSFSAQDMIEKGSLVTMKISNPSGGGDIEIEGRIVWSEEKKAYGVQFQNASQNVTDRILSWTRKLAAGDAAS